MLWRKKLQVQMLHSNPLKEEEKYILKEFVHSEAYPVFLKQLERMVIGEEKQLAEMSLNSEDDERRLIVAKLRSEGARKLFTSFRASLEKLKPKK